jgi:hypothetical protein
MSSEEWLRAYVGANTRGNIYAGSSMAMGRWQAYPSITGLYQLDLCCLSRAPTLLRAVQWNQDWQFEENDRGAYSLVLEGSRSAKNGLVLGFGSDRSDAFGRYLLIGDEGAQALRNVVGEYGPFGGYMEETLAPASGSAQAVPGALQSPGAVAITVVYEFGNIRVYSGMDPNNPGPMLVAYTDPTPGFGNNKWGLGLLGPENGDKLNILQIKKWI